MVKKLASAYNPQSTPERPPVSREEHLSCSAKGCPLPGSIQLNGDKWFCLHHVRAPKNTWPAITALLQNQARLTRILELVRKLTAAEFDQIQSNQGWQLEPMLVPVDGENYAQWSARVTDFVQRALKQKASEIIRDHSETQAFGGAMETVSGTVHELTNGSLLKRSKNKSREEQIKDAENWNGENAA